MDTSIDHFQLMANVVNTIPFNQIIGLSLQSIENDVVTMRFSMTPELIGNYLQGILHGGVISTVLDMAGGAAALMKAIQEFPEKSVEELATKLGKASTINLNINYLRPGRGNHFIAKSNVLQKGNKITFTSMSLLDYEDQLIASATGSYFVR